MPITETSDINEGDLRIFGGEGLKNRLGYKIICNFRRIRQICSINKL